MQRLRDVQVGDTVVKRRTGTGEIIERVKVVKVTATQITITGGERFLKRNGWKVGESKKTRGWFTFLYTEDEWKV